VSNVTIDARTGVLVIDGKKVFPIGFSNPPPLGKQAPSGKEGLQELADAGGNLIRTGIAGWSLNAIDAQLAAEKAKLDAAAAHGLHVWLWLGDVANLPPAGGPPSENAQLLTKIVNALKSHPALGAWKAIDEPRNPLNPNWIRPEGLVRAYKRLKTLDPNHPVVIIQAPRSSVAELEPYRPAYDITGVDIFPIAYPPAQHSDSPNRDLSVVGDMARKMAEASVGKPVWLTLQIAWTGTVRSKTRPDVVPCFPSFKEERFMAYQAIVNGARGLVFFGGHLTQVCTPEDAQAGWNWSFWQQTLRPLVAELASPELQPALLSTNARTVTVTTHTTGATDVEVVTRRGAGFFFVIAVKRGGSAVALDFTGLPPKKDGTPIKRGEVLFEYVQSPPPPPMQPTKQILRPISVTNGGFSDVLGPHDVHVYRFAL
jgi:hypothetical protein